MVKHQPVSRRRFSATACAGLVIAALISPFAARAVSANDVLTYRGPDRQQKLEAGAKKEGRLTVYSTLIVNQALQPLVEAFVKKYPYIKTDFSRSDAAKMVAKVLAEQRANALVGDVMETGGATVPLLKANALLPFYSPVFEEIPKEYIGKGGYFAISRLSYMGGVYNTKLVTPGSEPRTYEDLLDPKWKGKIAWNTQDESGAILMITNMLDTWGKDKTESWLAKFTEQKPSSVAVSARQLVNIIMAGEYPIGLSIFMHHAVISAQDGAPVAPIPFEPVASTNGSMAIPKGTKHPHAALLFVDFVLGEQGQSIMRDAQYFPVHPKVRPIQALAAVTPHLIGLKENFFDPVERFDGRSEAVSLIKKYFRQ
jgi:ABC-type Fe3+ transport system substrate-binding protein